MYVRNKAILRREGGPRGADPGGTHGRIPQERAPNIQYQYIDIFESVLGILFVNICQAIKYTV